MSRIPSLARKAAGGFTLIELLMGVSVVGVLSSIAYPSFEGVLHKARRADALVALMHVQMAQERWRSNHRAYGSLDEIGVAGASSARHYTLRLVASDANGYEVIASAAGPQARDTACRHLKLAVDTATVTQSSGPDETRANAPADNRRCWNL
jgi:type IV pilus assembly protein PilE